MFEIGFILLLLCILAFGLLFTYFGIDDRNPALFILGIAFFAAILIILSIYEVL